MNESRYREAERRLWESVGVRPTERRVQLARTGATVRVQEAGAGPPVVLVHGASTGGWSWAPLVGRLTGFRCLVLDRPGCGLSPPVAQRFDDVRGLRAFAEGFIVDVLDALDLDRAAVVATSFGGFMAFHAAAAHPDRIDRMVELGWCVGAPTRKMPMIMRVASVRAVGRLMTAVPVNERMVRSMLGQIGLRRAIAEGRVSQEAIDCFLSLLRDTNTMRNELEAGPRIMSLRGMNKSILLSTSLLGSVRAPTYFLWGEDDPFGGADIAHAFVGQVPGAHLELLPDVGHAPWIDAPDHIALAIAHHLEPAD